MDQVASLLRFPTTCSALMEDCMVRVSSQRLGNEGTLLPSMSAFEFSFPERPIYPLLELEKPSL